MAPWGPAIYRALARLAAEQFEREQFGGRLARVWAIPVFVWILAMPLPRRGFVDWAKLRKIPRLALWMIEIASHHAACRTGARRDLRKNAIARKVFSGGIP